MNRLKQPSTFAGIGLFLQIASGFFPQWSAVFTALTGAAGAAAVALNDGAPKA